MRTGSEGMKELHDDGQLGLPPFVLADWKQAQMRALVHLVMTNGSCIVAPG